MTAGGGPEILKTSAEITGTNHWDTAVKVGGHLLPCQSLTLELDAENMPALTVNLPVSDGVVVTLAQVNTGLGESTREALVAMGWTPPGPLKMALASAERPEPRRFTLPFGDPCRGKVWVAPADASPERWPGDYEGDGWQPLSPALLDVRCWREGDAVVIQYRPQQ